MSNKFATKKDLNEIYLFLLMCFFYFYGAGIYDCLLRGLFYGWSTAAGLMYIISRYFLKDDDE